MKLFNGKIEETILTLLFRGGAFSTFAIIDEVRRERGSATKQGVYRALRKLKKEEKVVIDKTMVTISALWVAKLRFLIEDKNDNDLLQNPNNLKKGEKLSIQLKGLIHADMVWAQLFSAIESKIPNNHPLYLYNPHDWSIVVRPDIDQLHLKILDRKQRAVFLTIGSATNLDKETTKETRSKGLETSINTKIKIHDYLTIIGDYIIQLKLSKQETELIDKVFTNQKNIESARAEFDKVLRDKLNTSLIIRKDPDRAKQLKKRLARDFLVPKRLRDF